MSKPQKRNNGNGQVDHRRQEVQQIVKNACDQLNAEGVDARNYVEQLAWLFFLKAFDESETRREEEAAFDDTPYQRRLSGPYAWSSWAKDTDHPDQMLEFVQGKLWTKISSPDPKKGLGDDLLAQRFRRIFENVRNYCRRGASFARVVQQVDKLHFSDDTDVHVLSEIYEDLLKRVAADSAGYAGEFYTQRHIIRAMVDVVQPQVGDRVYDPCFGTCGFLGDAADYMRDLERNPNARNLSGKDLEKLQKATFFGLENKPLTYLLGTMNMILHGIEGANLELANTLEVHSENVAEKDRYNVILSNPPYGGKMAQELQTNFRVRSSATECLFVQHIMRNLAKGGRAGVVIPEGVLFRSGPDQKVRKELLEQFNVHTILSLPAGCFLPYTGVKTNVIYFDRPKVEQKSGEMATESVWYYELSNDGFELKQTRRPIEGNQLPDFLKKWQKRTKGDNSWLVPIKDIIQHGYDLSAKNPNRKDDYEHRPALELVQSIKAKEQRIIDLLGELEVVLGVQA
jgi:type I restriction enzyme M protein